MFRAQGRPEYAVRSLLKTVRAATPIGSLPNHKSCREHGSEPGPITRHEGRNRLEYTRREGPSQWNSA